MGWKRFNEITRTDNVYYLTVYIDIIEYTQIHRNLYQQLVDRFDFIISSFHFG